MMRRRRPGRIDLAAVPGFRCGPAAPDPPQRPPFLSALLIAASTLLAVFLIGD